MSLPAYHFALSDDGVVSLSHGLASIASARSQRSGARKRSAVTRVVALLATGLGLAASMLMTGCGRSPSGALQETVPSGNHPPTPAFATNSLRTAGEPSVAPPTTQSPERKVSAGEAKEDEANARVCSIAGLVRAKRVSDEHYEIKRQDVDSVLLALRERAANPSDERLVNIRTENGLPGLRVRGVGSKAECGLAPDDILVSVNEIPVTDQAALSKNRDRLRSADEFRLMIERDRKTVKLRYDVRE